MTSRHTGEKKGLTDAQHKSPNKLCIHAEFSRSLLTTATEKRGIHIVFFSYFCMKTYVVGTH